MFGFHKDCAGRNEYRTESSEGTCTTGLIQVEEHCSSCGLLKSRDCRHEDKWGAESTGLENAESGIMSLVNQG